MNSLLYISNIGYTAYNNPMRAIRGGIEFEGLLPAPNWQTEVVKRNANVDETVREMQKLIRQSAWQTKELSKRLLGKDIYTTCGNIWKFLFSHIKYKEDDEGKEQLRTPALSWYLRTSRGIDCDDFSIFASTILYNLGIPHYLRIARYEGKSYFQHVYVVVPQAKQKYITIDAVLDEYDAEKEPAETKDFLVMDTNKLNGIEVTVLSGNEDEALNEIAGILFGVDFGEIEELEGLGDEPEEEKILGAIYNHLVRTRNAVRRYPHIVKSVEDPQTFLGMLDYGIKYWDTDKQELALGILEEKEEEINRLNGLDAMPEGYEETTVFYGVEGLSGVNALGKTKVKKAFFKNVKKAVQKTKQKVKQKAQNAKQKIKKAGAKLKKGIVKNNPVSVAARGGMLLAMKTNLLKIAEKLKWGYLTESEAREHGFDMAEWGNARTQLKKSENLFVDKLKGSPEKFKKAILTGRAGGLAGVTEELGVVAATAGAASITAAMPFIKKILEFAKAINMKKLIGKVKANRLAKKNKKAENQEVSEDAPTALPEDKESETPPAQDQGNEENDSKDTPQDNGSESGETTNNSETISNGVTDNKNETSETTNENTEEKNNSGGRTINNGSENNSNTNNKTAEPNDTENNGGEKTDDKQEGTNKNLPVPAGNKTIANKTDDGNPSNPLTVVTDWVKENPGKSALIVGGLVLAFSSGARHAIGLGKAPRKYKKKKGNKKNNPPKAISGTGKKNKKPKTVKRDKGKPKNNGGPKQVRL